MQLQLCFKEKLSGAGRPCSLVPLLGACAASLDFVIVVRPGATSSYPVPSTALQFSGAGLSLVRTPLGCTQQLLNLVIIVILLNP